MGRDSSELNSGAARWMGLSLHITEWWTQRINGKWEWSDRDKHKASKIWFLLPFSLISSHLPSCLFSAVSLPHPVPSFLRAFALLTSLPGMLCPQASACPACFAHCLKTFTYMSPSQRKGDRLMWNYTTTPKTLQASSLTPEHLWCNLSHLLLTLFSLLLPPPQNVSFTKAEIFVLFTMVSLAPRQRTDIWETVIK